jgi:glycosyltransferase involved in cell wall biosynthesis
MLRVLCFGRFFDDIPGGMQTHVDCLFRALNGKVDYVHLVPSRDSRGSAGQLHGFPLIRTPSINLDGSLAISPTLGSKAVAMHREKPFDLIHLHFPDPMSHLASMALPKSIPRIITWHADITRQKFLRAMYRPLQNRALAQAQAIVVYTPKHIESSNDLMAIPREKIQVIPYGFDLQPYQTAHPLAEKLRIQYGSKVIFALGRHVYYKGYEHLIEAMSKLPQETQLLIGGTGPLTSTWKELAQQSPAKARIHFLGLIPQDEVIAYYQCCQVFCLPAVNQAEAFGAVQVEAMACGKPVVSTRLNNGVDWVNQDGITGLTVPVADVPSLVGALTKLLEDTSLASELGKGAYHRAQSEFSLAALGEKTLNLYHHCAGLSSQKRPDNLKT